jgi:hypothetical protein
MKKNNPIEVICSYLLIIILLTGCSTLERVPAVPSDHDFAEVEIVGVPDVRYDIFTKSGINELISDFHKSNHFRCCKYFRISIINVT